nr:ribonuclease H-like domain-containing protein [Tanacetum cinerariifolium]
MDQDSAHMLAASTVPMLKPGEYEIWRMRIEQYVKMIDYALWDAIENGATLPKTKTVKGAMTEMSITTTEEKAQRRLEVKARSNLIMGISNKHQLKFNSIKDAKKSMEALEKRFGGNEATKKTQRNLLKQQYENFTASCSKMKILIGFKSLECRASRHQDNKNKESSRRSMHVETTTSTALVSCDGLGGYDWSDQAEEGPNYALMAFSSLSFDAEKSELMVLGYKLGLESVEEKLEFFKTNESIYLQDIMGLKFEIQIREITIRELRKKLEIVQKEKDGIQLNVDKFEHASKSLNKLIVCQIVDNCKKGLGYKNYNVVPSPYTGNFMPPTPNLSFTSLDEFVNKTIVENCKAMSSEEEPKIVRKYDDAPRIKERVSDDEKEDVSQPKIEKKTVKPSIVKIEFVKSKQQEKTARKIVKQVEQHRKNTHSPRGNQRN